MPTESWLAGRRVAGWLLVGAGAGLLAWGQNAAPAQSAAPAKSAAAKPAAKPKPASGVDKILEMVKLGLPEQSIVSAIQANASSLNVTVDDLLRFKKAGASDGVINALSGVMTGAAAEPAKAAETPAAPAAAPVPAASASQTRLSVLNTDLASVGCEASKEARKHILAADEFEYGTVMSWVEAVFGTNVNIGKGILALFTKRIQQEGKYRIVERANIKKVLAEQDFGASNRVKQGTQSRIGRILGADAILMGDIVVFGRDDRKKKIGVGGWVPRIPGVGGASIKWGDDKAVVAISYRLVDAETSEVIDTGEARGESSRKSKGIAVGGVTSSGGGAVDYDMGSQNFAQTIIGEATINCVDQLAQLLNAQEAKVKMAEVEAEGRVAEVMDKQIIISVGAADGVLKCDRFEIHKVLKELKDPVTKEVIDILTEKVGQMVATEVRDRVSIGYYNGTAVPETGFIARKVLAAQ